MPLVFGYDSANHAPKGPTARSVVSRSQINAAARPLKRSDDGRTTLPAISANVAVSRPKRDSPTGNRSACAVHRPDESGLPGTVSPRTERPDLRRAGQRVEIPSHDDRIALGAQSFGHRAALLHAGLRGGKIDVRAGEDDRIWHRRAPLRPAAMHGPLHSRSALGSMVFSVRIQGRELRMPMP